MNFKMKTPVKEMQQAICAIKEISLSGEIKEGNHFVEFNVTPNIVAFISKRIIPVADIHVTISAMLYNDAMLMLVSDIRMETIAAMIYEGIIKKDDVPDKAELEFSRLSEIVTHNVIEKMFLNHERAPVN